MNLNLTPNNTFFTADYHFGHGSILRHQSMSRPFTSTEQMDDVIIQNVNAIVPANAVLFHLGDFSWKASLIGHYRHRIKCRNMILIRGNHEPKGWDAISSHFSGVYDLKMVKVKEQEIVLCHYAMRVWNKSHHGAWHLYGHSHGSLPDDPGALSMDIGIDCWDLCPVSFAQIKHKMQEKTWKPVDHHTAD